MSSLTGSDWNQRAGRDGEERAPGMRESGANSQRPWSIGLLQERAVTLGVLECRAHRAGEGCWWEERVKYLHEPPHPLGTL